MSWYPFDEGKSIGQRGSENGVICRDQEHADGARITLEQGGTTAPYAITCGIYGWMFHTCYFGSEPKAQQAFQAMESELAKILTMIPANTDPDADAKSDVVTASISSFVKRFP